MSRPRPPQIKARRWQDGGRTIPGIAFMRGQRVLAHMTAAQARNTADKLHDLADELEQQARNRSGNTAHKAGISAHHPQPKLTAADGTEEPPLPTTPAE